MLILVVFSDLTTFRVLAIASILIVVVAFMAYVNIATYLPIYFPKASRPRSILIVLTIYPTLVSKQVLLLKSWYL
jgi:hypothetical protein